MTNLQKRIFTSIFLFIITIISILIHKVIFTFAIFIISVICFYEWNNINIPYFIKKRKKGIIFIQIAGLIYLFIFFVTSFFIYNEIGKVFFIYILLICACSDIGGYIFGKTIGGKKLTKVSPNKTISGSIGSFIFSIIPIALFYFQAQLNLSIDFTLKNIIFCLIVSLSCQAGDLIISYFKRLNKIKNTGKILPGHGGLLDRIDGIIFAVPIAFILEISQIFI